MKTELPMITKRECGTCTKCCEGWLTGNIKGHDMYPGKPCFFVEIGKGCKDYKNRPKNPCKNFLCGWRLIDDMPEEFKPEKTGVIVSLKKENDIEYMVLSKAPNNPTEQLLSWAIVFARLRNLNILWYIDDKSWWMGSEDFSKQMAEEHKDV
jgi:hypothetical protein